MIKHFTYISTGSANVLRHKVKQIREKLLRLAQCPSRISDEQLQIHSCHHQFLAGDVLQDFRIAPQKLRIQPLCLVKPITSKTLQMFVCNNYIGKFFCLPFGHVRNSGGHLRAGRLVPNQLWMLLRRLEHLHRDGGILNHGVQENSG